MASLVGGCYSAGVGVLDFVDAELARLAAEDHLRVPDRWHERAVEVVGARGSGAPLVDVSSNDYLGFARRPVSRETIAPPEVAGGAGASRLIHGTCEPHDRLETALATWLGYPTTLLFSSGYAANVGVLSALCGPGDLIVSDALNHASIIDGCRLSRATVAVVPHCDLDAVERALAAPARRRFVVTEAYFSMDGDGPTLPRLARLARAAGAAWILDEAHSLGVFGPAGRGLAAEAGVTPDLMVGTLGKAFGLQGAFVATTAPVRTFLWNRARSFVFSTATSPLLAHLGAARLLDLREAERERRHLHALATAALEAIARHGLTTTADRPGPILPILLGDPARAQRAAAALLDHGFLARAIRPPTVPPGTSRLRLVLHADLTHSDLARLMEVTARA